MNGDVRRAFEMVGRTVDFSDERPDTDAGHNVSVSRLKEIEVEMEAAATAQRAGLIDVHTGVEEKRRLRREMLAGPIVHVSEICGLAAKDHPELAERCRYRPDGDTYLAHRTASRDMQREALTYKDLLAPYGLSEAVLQVFGQLLDRFDAAVRLGSDGRALHIGATRQLETLAQEADQIVRSMDIRNQYRFKDDEQALGAWNSASTIVARRPAVPGESPATPVSGPGPVATPSGTQGGAQSTPPNAGGDVRPAA
jgi:hypothetical protein